MSINHKFPSDIPVSDLESFNDSVFRTVSTIPDLPWSEEDVRFNSEFVLSDNLNRRIKQIYDNISYLCGFATIYNSVIPIDSIRCPEFDIDKDNLKGMAMLPSNPDIQVTYTSKKIYVYKNGIIYKTIEETELGTFKDIQDIILYKEFMYIMDGGVVIKVKDYISELVFLTFFGGYGGKTSEYKFRNPSKFSIDYKTGNIYVWDKGNGVIKKYTEDFSYTDTIEMNGINFDVFDDKLYILYENYIDVIDEDSTNIYSISVDSCVNILIDFVQEGFLWIASEDKITKISTNGLMVGEYAVNGFKDFSRSGTKLHIITNDGWVNTLDYSFSQTILKDDINKLLSMLETPVLFESDELCSDVAINRIIINTHNTIEELVKSTIGKFIKYIKPNGSIEDIQVATIPPLEYKVPCGSYVRSDEMVSCHTINRVFGKIFEGLFGYIEHLEVDAVVDSGDSYSVNKDNNIGSGKRRFTLTMSEDIINDEKSSNFDMTNQGFSLSDFGNAILEGFDTGLHTIKKITVKRGFNPPKEDNGHNFVSCLLLDRKRVVLTKSENTVNFNELGSNEEAVFTFPHVAPLVANTNDYQYIMSFIDSHSIPNATNFVSLDLMLLKKEETVKYAYEYEDLNGDIHLVTGNRSFTSRNDSLRNEAIWIKVEGTSDLVVDMEHDDEVTDLTPANWQIGAHECEGLSPQLYSTSVTPISVEELKRPDLDCLDLTNPVTSALSCEPVIIPNIPPNTVSGTIKEFRCDT